MGASAVLLFAVPHGALSQPWPVLGGHLLSAVIGVICARSIDSPALAAACAVGFAIGAMHHFRCIHPPGGATALTAVLGGTAIHDLGFHYILMPVMANALVMLLLAVAINFCFPWRRYPAAFNRPAVPLPAHHAQDPPLPTHEEIAAALRSLDTFVDITEDDLLRLIEILKPYHAAASPSAFISSTQMTPPPPSQGAPASSALGTGFTTASALMENQAPLQRHRPGQLGGPPARDG